MKILYVHECFGALAGAEANAQITAEELGRRGHAIGLLHGPPTGAGQEKWNATFPERWSLEGADPAAAARQAVEAFRPDVVYVHKMADLGVIEALLETGCPCVRMVHDHDIYCMRSYKYNFFTRRICTRPAGWRCVFPCLATLTRNRKGPLPVKWTSLAERKRDIALNRRFRRMVVVTTYMRDELLRNGFEAARIRIHGPVPRMGEAGLRSTFSDRNLILYAGQIIRGKGVDVLLQALAKVWHPFECIILGDGNHRPACEKLRDKLGLADKVHFKGFIPQEELKAYYRECSVVVISSVWPEPIATIGLEVMRYALPVVAFDAGGIKDWLSDGQTGYLVPWMDTEAYANRVDDLLGDKALARRLGENGFRFVSEHYDFETYLGDLEKMFAEAIEEHNNVRHP